ncbi:hypothetical protein NP493_1134g01001 [Ridgeia piscesae]|uniref:Uncharacterized protein n=1 Tax=Ridgeia piscesae TaxID=27915 RepID=A0AAD9KEL9_RIDPI|nr:hypothetical protein NP493_1134g01001 [Ridgeia piscesae]
MAHSGDSWWNHHDAERFAHTFAMGMTTTQRPSATERRQTK